MGKRVKAFTAILCACLLLLPGISVKGAEGSRNIRIGLNYGSDSVSSVKVKAAAGIEIGYADAEGPFRLLVDQPDSKAVIIRKDGNFVKTEKGELLEYSPTEGVPYAGEVIGPWHLKIGDNAADFSVASSLAVAAKNSGVNAYVVYEKGWQVWTGFYVDQRTAEEASGQIKAALGIDTVTVTPESFSRLILYDESFNVLMVYGGADGYLQVRPKQQNNPSVVSANGKQYRGYLEIRRYTGSDMTLINILDLEHYLYGVVPAEIEADAPLEAVKAQAVAARTYTLKNPGKNSKWGFDLTDSTSDQVYKGYDGERAYSNQAVDETKGKKMLYNGVPANVFYFASSGGMTASAKEVWGSDIPYLVSVPDPYESEIASRAVWEKVLTAEQIKKTLFISNVEIGDILSVSAEEYTPSGRVNALRITGTEGSITYYGTDTRFLFDLNSQKYTIQSAGTVVVKAADGSLKTLALDGRTVVSAGGTGVLSAKNATLAAVGSGNYVSKINMSSNSYVFNGRGWGHGVGMSQEGAKGFARQGYTYDQILKHYFTGVTIE
jgi:stage II sporulation protein D